MYLYDSEDNAPMSEDAWEAARMLGAIAREPTIEEEPVPFTDPLPDDFDDGGDDGDCFP